VTEERSPREILAAWRAAEQRAARLAEGSAEWHRARLEAEDLAREYQAALAQRLDSPSEDAAGNAADVET